MSNVKVEDVLKQAAFYVRVASIELRKDKDHISADRLFDIMSAIELVIDGVRAQEYKHDKT